jgi:hypothetical protein
MKSINFKYFEDINAYHFGELSEQDKTLFEAKLILDQQLGEEYDHFQEMIKLVKKEHQEELLQCFAIEDKVLDKDLLLLSRRSKIPLYLLIAALMSLIVVFLLR